MHRSPQTYGEAVFATRGWLTEHPAAFRSLVVSAGVPVEIQPGACIFRRGDEANGLYGIVSGAVGIEGGHHRQSPLLNHVLRNGEWFGLKAVLGGGLRELTYRTLEPTRLLLLSRSRLVPLMHAEPDVAVRVGQLAELATRLGNWITRDLQTPDAGRRLAAVLFRVLGAGEVVPENPGGFRLSHQQLGEMANVSRHYVGRKLASFEQAGWIRCGYNRIRLLDGEALAAFAYGDEEN
jgi:CRP/FNR family transcriptional regulator, cyclic AMP receptor protein